MAVVSSSSYRTEVMPPLQRAGLLPYFEDVIFGNDVKHFKPAPDPYLLAVERLRVRSPLVIEDSDAGVAAGKAAGLEVLRVTGVEQMPSELRAHLAKHPSTLRALVVRGIEWTTLIKLASRESRNFANS